MLAGGGISGGGSQVGVDVVSMKCHCGLILLSSHCCMSSPVWPHCPALSSS